MNRIFLAGWIFLFGFVTWASQADAHHVLGRPSYSVNEDSNTPPSMQMETQLGKYSVVVTAFPAFPKPGQLTVVKLIATHLKTNIPFPGPVHFFVRDDVWFGDQAEEKVGTQERPMDGGIFNQGIVFEKEGFYIVGVQFEAEGEPYLVDIPMQLGDPTSFGPLLGASGVVVLILVAVSAAKRAKKSKRLARKDRVSLARDLSQD